MKTEQGDIDGDCIQIGYQKDAKGQITGREYLLTRENLIFTIEIVGVPPFNSGSASLRDLEIPPLPVPRDLLANPGEICQFLLSAPLSLLNPHLVPEILPEEINPNNP